MVLCVKRTQSNKLEGSLRIHEEAVGMGLLHGRGQNRFGPRKVRQNKGWTKWKETNAALALSLVTVTNGPVNDLHRLYYIPYHIINVRY